MNAIETARAALLPQLQTLKRDHAEAKERVRTIEHELNQIEAALKALGGTKTAKAKGGGKPSKPCARKQEVMAVCLALVEANQPIAKDDLESLAKHKIAEDLGFSLSGVSLRLAECLKSDVFQMDKNDCVVSSDSVAPLDASLVSFND